VLGSRAGSGGAPPVLSRGGGGGGGGGRRACEYSWLFVLFVKEAFPLAVAAASNRTLKEDPKRVRSSGSGASKTGMSTALLKSQF
jgi:hypothetical protein